MQNKSLDVGFRPFLLFKLLIYALNLDKLNTSSLASPAAYPFAPKPHYYRVLLIYLRDSTEAYICSRFD